MKDHQRRLLELLNEIGPRLHALLTRVTLRADVAEELMQDLFLRLSDSRGFATAGNPSGYAYATAMNLAFSWRRSQDRMAQVLSNTGRQVSHQDPPLEKLIADERIEQTLSALDHLPDTQREVLVMTYIQQEPDEVIAELIGRSPHQVRGLRHKAIVALREQFQTEKRHHSPEEVSHDEH